MRRIFDWARQKKEYLFIACDLIIATAGIVFASGLKWKILILTMCVRGISYELGICFSNHNMIKCEKAARIVHNVLTFGIIVVGSIVLIAGLSK